MTTPPPRPVSDPRRPASTELRKTQVENSVVLIKAQISIQGSTPEHGDCIGGESDHVVFNGDRFSGGKQQLGVLFDLAHQRTRAEIDDDLDAAALHDKPLALFA